MKKKVLLVVLLLFLIVSSSVFADDLVSVGIYVKGASLPAQGYIVNGRTMVPLRALAEALDFEVSYEANKKEVTIKKDGFVDISLIVGEKVARLGERSIELDSPSFIKDSRTFVPLRFISESLGEPVKWYGEERLVSVGSFQAKMAKDYEYQPMYIEYIDGYLLMPKDWEEEVEVKTIKEGNHAGFYIIDKHSRELMDKEYPEGLNGVLYRFVKAEKPWDPVEKIYLLREFEGKYLMVLPDSDFNFTKETSEHHKNLMDKYEKVFSTFSALSKENENSFNIVSTIKSEFIPERYRDYPLQLARIDDSYVYSLTEFKDDGSVDVGFYFFFDKEWNFLDYLVKFYNDDKLIGKEISLEEGRKLAENFDKRVLGEENPKITHKANLFVNRYEEGVNETYQDEKGGRYLVNLKLGLLIAYDSKLD